MTSMTSHIASIDKAEFEFREKFFQLTYMWAKSTSSFETPMARSFFKKTGVCNSTKNTLSHMFARVSSKTPEQFFFKVFVLVVLHNIHSLLTLFDVIRLRVGRFFSRN